MSYSRKSSHCGWVLDGRGQRATTLSARGRPLLPPQPPPWHQEPAEQRALAGRGPQEHQRRSVQLCTVYVTIPLRPDRASLECVSWEARSPPEACPRECALWRTLLPHLGGRAWEGTASRQRALPHCSVRHSSSLTQEHKCARLQH